MCAEHLTEVIVSGMEAYIPYTFSTPHAKKPWFNHACSRAVQDREAAHRRYQTHRNPADHDLYISARNRAKSIFQLTKKISSIESVKTLLLLNLPVTPGILPKIFPPTLLL